MTRRGTRPVAVATTLPLLGGLAGAGLIRGGPAAAGTGLDSGKTAGRAKPIRLADTSIIIETNATDGDAGLQVFLDGEDWREMSVTGRTDDRCSPSRTREASRPGG